MQAIEGSPSIAVQDIEAQHRDLFPKSTLCARHTEDHPPDLRDDIISQARRSVLGVGLKVPGLQLEASLSVNSVIRPKKIPWKFPLPKKQDTDTEVKGQTSREEDGSVVQHRQRSHDEQEATSSAITAISSSTASEAQKEKSWLSNLERNEEYLSGQASKIYQNPDWQKDQLFPSCLDKDTLEKIAGSLSSTNAGCNSIANYMGCYTHKLDMVSDYDFQNLSNYIIDMSLRSYDVANLLEERALFLEDIVRMYAEDANGPPVEGEQQNRDPADQRYRYQMNIAEPDLALPVPKSFPHEILAAVLNCIINELSKGP